MIHVRADSRNGQILSMKINGHAMSDEYGKDLVCAAVSAIAFGLGNALDELKSDADVTIQDNLVSITVHTPDDTTETILKTGLIQLETIQEVNQDYVKIEKREV